jgi:hypothetical protein
MRFLFPRKPFFFARREGKVGAKEIYWQQIKIVLAENNRSRLEFFFRSGKQPANGEQRTLSMIRQRITTGGRNEKRTCRPAAKNLNRRKEEMGWSEIRKE